MPKTLDQCSKKELESIASHYQSDYPTAYTSIRHPYRIGTFGLSKKTMLDILRKHIPAVMLRAALVNVVQPAIEKARQRAKDGLLGWKRRLLPRVPVVIHSGWGIADIGVVSKWATPQRVIVKSIIGERTFSFRKESGEMHEMGFLQNPKQYGSSYSVIDPRCSQVFEQIWRVIPVVELSHVVFSYLFLYVSRSELNSL